MRLAAALLVALLAGCGSDDSSSEKKNASGGSAGTSGSGGVASGGTSGDASTSGGAGGSTGGSAGASGSKLIQVDPAHPAWLRHEDGTPHFLCAAGDPEGFLYRGSRNADGTRAGDQTELIQKLAASGANGIYLIAVRSHGGDGAADENPFVDSDPANGLDQEILDQWESWFSAADTAGVVVYFFIYDDSASLWSTGDAVEPEEKSFVEALVDRFEHHDHLVWVVAEEYSEALSPTRASALAATIRASDARQHAIGVHQLDGLDFDFASDANVDQFTIQHNVATREELHTGVVKAFGDAAGAYNLNLSEAADYGTGATARQKSWAIALGGAYVMVLGMDIASSSTDDLGDCGRLRSFMESTRFSEMAPHDELAQGQTEYVLAKPGEAYIAYAASADALGLAGLDAGSYRRVWFDPASGARVEEGPESLAAGDASFAKPSSFGAEVALYLVKQ